MFNNPGKYTLFQIDLSLPWKPYMKYEIFGQAFQRPKILSFLSKQELY